jgi:ABC-type transporter Mla MlaB component
VGIFSLFGKKDVQQQKAAEKDAPRTRRPATSSSTSAPPTSTRPEKKSPERAAPPKRDAHLARATVLKIDAIESEMSYEFVNATTTRPGPDTRSAPSAAATPAKPPAGKTPAAGKPDAKASAAPPTLQPLAPGMGATTDFLLHGNSTVNDVATPFSEAAAVIEESAIMYANGQNDLVEQMLLDAIAEDLLGDVTRTAWWMLFDLYQLGAKREEFEQLAMAYANKFETSPPAWTEAGKWDREPAATSGSTPLVSFTGKLDAKASKNTERVRKLAETHRALRLEFARVSEVDREGCRLLLEMLKQLQKSGHDLVLVGARELADKVRAIIGVGRRDGEDCWLLLLEILRLLNCEKEFEEASIDYCVTFEVSPPAFIPPQASVTTAATEQAAPDAAEGFVMPALVEGRIDNLILAIAAYSDEHEPAIIDCAQLARVDFNAAGRLLTGLAPFCGNGKTLEFHHVNHLVAELFNIIGLKDVARIVPRKS